MPKKSSDKERTPIKLSAVVGFDASTLDSMTTDLMDAKSAEKPLFSPAAPQVEGPFNFNRRALAEAREAQVGAIKKEVTGTRTRQDTQEYELQHSTKIILGLDEREKSNEVEQEAQESEKEEGEIMTPFPSPHKPIEELEGHKGEVVDNISCRNPSSFSGCNRSIGSGKKVASRFKGRHSISCGASDALSQAEPNENVHSSSIPKKAF